MAEGSSSSSSSSTAPPQDDFFLVQHVSQQPQPDLQTQPDDLQESPETEEEMKEAFDAFDEDRNGFISANELQSVLSKIGIVKTSVEECEEMIRKVDLDGDGRIDFLEFKQMMGFLSTP